MGVVAIVTYFVAYGFGLAVDGQPHGVRDVVAASAALVVHHAALTDMKNPWVSGWITWFVPVRPLLMGYFRWRDGVRVLSSLGKPDHLVVGGGGSGRGRGPDGLGRSGRRLA